MTQQAHQGRRADARALRAAFRLTGTRIVGLDACIP